VHPAEVGLLPPADERVVEAVLRVGVVGQRHLVELGVAGAVGELDQVDEHAGAGRRPGHLGQPAYVGHLELAALAAEPPGIGDVVLDGVGDRLGGHGMNPPSALSASVRRNQ
jgi:hypothetical protein